MRANIVIGVPEAIGGKVPVDDAYLVRAPLHATHSPFLPVVGVNVPAAIVACRLLLPPSAINDDAKLYATIGRSSGLTLAG